MYWEIFVLRTLLLVQFKQTGCKFEEANLKKKQILHKSTLT